MRHTETKLNGKDTEPTQLELEIVWQAMEDAAEDGWLSPDENDNVEQEVDETDLRTLLGDAFSIIDHPHLCGFYRVHDIYGKNPTYVFEQWGSV